MGAVDFLAGGFAGTGSRSVVYCFGLSGLFRWDANDEFANWAAIDHVSASPHLPAHNLKFRTATMWLCGSGDFGQDGKASGASGGRICTRLDS